jgi:hypothetical protein
VAGVFLALPLATHAATIINGSFENVNAPPAAVIASSQLYTTGSTGITGWTVTRDGVERFSLGSGAPDGSFAIDLAYYTSSTGGGIRQSVATTPGQTFTLAFAASTVQAAGRNGTAEIILMIDGADAQTYSLTNLTSTTSWENFTYEVTPTGNSTVIEFQNRQNALLHFANIDHVRVIPEPGSALLTLLGTLTLIRRRRH